MILKKLFKKLYFMNTRRMLEILKFKPSQVELKKLQVEVKKEQSQNEFTKEVPGMMRKNSKAVLQNIGEFEEKVLDLAQIYPSITSSMQIMRQEMEQLVNKMKDSNLNKSNHSDLEILKLYQELTFMKQQEGDTQSRKVLIEDWFAP